MKIVCIPAFNEEKTISDIIKRSLPYVDSVIVYDDGSTDNTARKAEESGAKVLRNEKNVGKGAALKSLFQYAREIEASVAVTIDGDGQFLPEEIPKIMKPIIENGFDIVIGYRFDSGDQMPSYRKVGNKVLDKITNAASNLPFRDTQSGFRAYSKKAIDLIDFKTSGFGADAEILINASQKGLKIAEEKVTVLYETGGKTSTKNPISHSFEVISLLLEIISIRHPLRYLGIPGFILSITGIIFSVITISTFNQTRYFSIPFTLVSMGSIIIGLMMLLMSVVLFSIGRLLQRES